ncbi:hypothetical protein BFW01_g10107 [Lasiodiplodia theobromae]|nr:hypothetical protein BFW01_g10107 [Lasiodiplodia theobromae]
MPRETLIKFLDQPNPFLDIRISSPSKVTGKATFGWPYIPTATEWKLTPDYIKHTFGFLLYKEFDFPDHFVDLPDTRKIVYDERSFRLLLTQWNTNIVDIALGVVSEALAHVPEFPKLCVASGSSGISNDEIGKPDFAVLPSETPAGMQHTCLAPGIVKVTRKHYNFFNPGDMSNIWAKRYLAEMSHYANTRGTRYFWCITPVQLMVCRRRASDTQGQIVPEVATFSWVPGPHQGISVNLALFFVVLAAGLGNDVRSSYKDISIEHREKLQKIKAAVGAL